MPNRLRLLDVRLSRLPGELGVDATNIPEMAQRTNTAQRRLLMAKEASDEGWYGTWSWIEFNLPIGQNWLVTPREVARIEVAAVCGRTAQVQNQFYRYLQFGNRRFFPRWLDSFRHRGWTNAEILSENDAPTIVPITNAPQIIQVYAANPADTSPNPPRVLLSGTDNNGNVIYSQDGLSRVQGQFVALQQPFATAALQMSTITSVQKDITAGPVQIFQTDPNSGAQVLLLTMEPTEQSTNYRRYFLSGVPCCCGPFQNPCLPSTTITTPTLQVSAICKLELIPVMTDTDFCLISDLEAIIEEAQSAKYSAMENTEAYRLSAEHHKAAIGHLNGQLAHYLGKNTPAVQFAPFGSANLERVNIGMI